MARRKDRIRAAAPMVRGRTPTDLAIEGMWLGALTLVPLVFNGRNVLYFFSDPKQYVLHFAALSIVVLWSFELAFTRRGVGRPGWHLTGWAGRSPARWALIAVAAFFFWQVLSTLLSPLAVYSALGRDPNNPGYELYSSLSYAAIFFAIALRVRTPAQVMRVLVVIVGVGAVTAAYGVAQHFGWDPIGYGSELDRVYATFGNPIFFAAFLIMSLTLTVALALVDDDGRRRWRVPVLAVLTGVQIAALWFTLSRGPWLGGVAAIALLAVGAVLWMRRWPIGRAGVVLTVGVALALVIAALPGATAAATGRSGISVAASILSDPAAVGELFSTSDDATGPAPGAAPSAPESSQLRLPAEPPTSFAIRVSLWETALKLATAWPVIDDEPAPVRVLRPLLGYGPEMSYYSYPLRLPPQRNYQVVDHAHNLPLNVLLELGYVGLLLSVVAVVLVVLSVVGLLRRVTSGGRKGDVLAAAAIATAAALGGRMVEQMVGVARVGDLLAFWALLGLLLAVYEIVMRGDVPARTSGPGPRPRREVISGGQVAATGAALVLAFAAAGLFAGIDVQALRASRMAAVGDTALGRQDPDSAYRQFQEAADTNPLVEDYPVAVNLLLMNTARFLSGPEDRDRALIAMGRAEEVLTAYAARHPLAYTTQVRLALTVSEIAARGEPQVLPVLADRVERVAALLPPYPTIMSFVAHGLVTAKEYEKALAAADRALSLGGPPASAGQAHWVKGVALAGLGRTDEAIAAFEGAIALQPDEAFGSHAKKSLVRLLDRLGRSAEADKYRLATN